MAVSGFSANAWKWAYATLFVVIIPVLLVMWSIATTDIVPLPVLPFRWAGFVVLTLASF